MPSSNSNAAEVSAAKDLDSAVRPSELLAWTQAGDAYIASKDHRIVALLHRSEDAAFRDAECDGEPRAPRPAWWLVLVDEPDDRYATQGPGFTHVASGSPPNGRRGAVPWDRTLLDEATDLLEEVGPT